MEWLSILYHKICQNYKGYAVFPPQAFSGESGEKHSTAPVDLGVLSLGRKCGILTYLLMGRHLMDHALGTLLQSLGAGAAFADISAVESIYPYVTFIIRFLLPALAAVILLRCLRSLLQETYEPEVWGYLSLPNASRVALYHWENVIGRAKSADVVLNYPTLSRSHLALIRDDKARWTAIDLGSKSGVFINGKRVNGEGGVKKGDVLSMGGVDVALLELLPEEVSAQRQNRTRPGWWIRPSGIFFFITLFQVLLAIQHMIAGGAPINPQIPVGFFALMAVMWGYFFMVRMLRRTGFEVEALAFFLSSIGLSILASTHPNEVLRGVFFIFLGVCFFLIICFILRDLTWAKKLRWPIAVVGIVFLAVGFLFADEVFGARRWIEIAGFTIQPSEFVKIAFVFAGAASLERLFTRRNLFLFIAYSGMCLVILALMRDFGSAAVFFATFLVIAFLRSGDVATIALSLAALVFGGFLAFMVVPQMAPHVATRFATWGNVWDYPFGAGMQQVRTLSSVASGGLFGLGAGEGSLRHVVASYTDMVFGIISEELGLIVAVLCLGAIVILGVFAVRASATARSSFYVIGAGAAVTIFMSQVILNVFGPLDVIPFTGITFPFVSRGGSSMLASWGLLAFIKAADTRQNASLAIKLGRRTMREAPMPPPGDLYEAEEDYEEDVYEDDAYEDEDMYEEDVDEYDTYEDAYAGEIYEDEEAFAEPFEGGIDSRYFDDREQENELGIDSRYFDDRWEGER